MLLKRIFISLLILATSSLAYAGPIISQFAADLNAASYTADATYLPTTSTYLAENAFNGTGPWNAGTTGWHWIQADMGSIQTLTEIKLQTAQAPNDVTQHQVFLSDTFIGNSYNLLTPIYSRSGFTAHGTILDIVFDQDYSGRYLQILVNNGATSWTALGDSNGRIDWVQTPANNSVPEPSTLALLSLCLAGLGFRKKS